MPNSWAPTRLYRSTRLPEIRRKTPGEGPATLKPFQALVVARSGDGHASIPPLRSEKSRNAVHARPIAAYVVSMAAGSHGSCRDNTAATPPCCANVE